ncbi:ATP-binding protein [Streptomyces sp. NPDC048384]|uniref:ATP-binding protein n=1 Tax=Streptomyces sp. NPDC048384 TaxID=3155487 RepID=UPI003415DBAE
MYATAPGSPRLELAGTLRHTGTGHHPTATASAESARLQAVTLTRDLEHAPRSVGRARHLTREFLGLSDTDAAEGVVLVVSELVTNAIEHALPPVMLHLHRETAGNRVWVGVSDGGPTSDEGAWTSSCTDDEHGRGLSIVDTLADTHGTRPCPNGTVTHWARLHAPPSL